MLLVEPLAVGGCCIGREACVCGNFGTWHPFCLGNSRIQCSSVVIVRAFQTSSRREAADTRSLSGEDALEALGESTPPVHPEVCSGCNQTVKTHVTCVGHAVATSDWECWSRSACCPRRDVVRGWQY